jgi:hypothetical protein
VLGEQQKQLQEQEQMLLLLLLLLFLWLSDVPALLYSKQAAYGVAWLAVATCAVHVAVAVVTFLGHRTTVPGYCAAQAGTGSSDSSSWASTMPKVEWHSSFTLYESTASQAHTFHNSPTLSLMFGFLQVATCTLSACIVAAAVAARYGQDHILMQIEFPKDYPHQPFFVRVVSPR